MRLAGRVLDGAGEPVPDAMVEIWQADASGGHRAASAGAAAAPTPTAATASSPSSPGGDGQAPHLDVLGLRPRPAEAAADPDLLPGRAEANAADPLLAALADAERAALIAPRDGDGELRFDIHLQGERQTTFFAL